MLATIKKHRKKYAVAVGNKRSDWKYRQAIRKMEDGDLLVLEGALAKAKITGPSHNTFRRLHAVVTREVKRRNLAAFGEGVTA